MAGAGEVEFRFAVLGPLTVSSDGAEVDVGGDLRRGLLVRLLMAANRPIQAGQLAEDLWNGRPPPGASSTLQSHISALRRIVGAARLVNRHGSYRLTVGADELDVARFEDLARRGRQALSAGPTDPTRAAEALGAALACWRGAALADVADASWARGEITRLEELRAATLEGWLQARLGLGDHVGVVGAAENALAADPLRERLWGQLMVALYRCGRQAEALRAYQRLRARLGEELGIEPTGELRALEDAILLQKPELDWQNAASAAAASSSSVPGGPSAAGPEQPGSGDLPPVTPSAGSGMPPAVSRLLTDGVVTFLFTDIEGSTSLWEQNPSLMAATVERHDRMISDIVATTGGAVFQTVGDAVHAVFASPVAALQAALSVQAAITEADWGETSPLAVRVGVYTGEADFVDGDWRGRPLNRCARLRDAGRGGQILASHATVELAGDDLARQAVITDIGEQRLRGVPRSERVHLVAPRIRATGPPAPTLAPRDALPTPLARAARRTLVGRAAELDRLIRDVSGPDEVGQVVLVRGEAGVGKTRLAAAVAQSAVDAGALVLFGRCDESLRVPYQPFVETLDAYIGSVPADMLAVQFGSTGHELSRLLPGLAERVTGLRPPTLAEPETERWLLFTATSQFLKTVAADRRLLLVIDDLHWAEPSTLLLLRHLVRAAIDNVRIVATARPADLADPDAFAQTLADLARGHALDTINLRGLNDQEVTALVGDRLQRGVDTGFAHAVHAETGGNPFFVHELISHLRDLGLLDDAATDWPTPAELQRSGAPVGVRHVLARRIAQLSSAARDVLSVAAVAGSEFRAAEIAAAAGASLDNIMAGLEDAAAGGLIAETARAPGVYRFAHSLVRHTLYDGISALRQAQLHWRLAEAVRSGPRRPELRLNELAYHYRHGLHAGDVQAAVPWLQQAGDQAVRQLAFEEAVEHYQAALDALDLCPEDPDRRYDLLAGLADAAGAVSDFAVSDRAWLAAADIARTARDSSRFFRAVVGYGTLISMEVGDGTFERLIADGLQLAGPGDSAERAQLLAWGGGTLWQGGAARPREEREGIVREGLAMARRVQDLPAQSWALGSLVHVLLGSSRADEQLALHQERLRLMEALGPNVERDSAYRRLGLCALQLGRREDAKHWLEQAETLSRAANRRLGLYNALIVNAAIATGEGRFDEAKSLVVQTRDVGGSNILAVALSYIAQIAAARAEQGRAERVIEDFSPIGDDPSPFTAAWRAMLAGLCADVGRLDAAARQFESLAPQRFGIIPRDWAFPLAVRYLAEACAQLGDAERAAQLLPEVEAYSGQLLVVTMGTSIEGAADRALAQLYGVLGRFDDADRCYESAWRLEDAMGFAPLAARSRYWHARLLARSSEHNHWHRARGMLRTVQTISHELGMTLLHQQASSVTRPFDQRY